MGQRRIAAAVSVILVAVGLAFAGWGPLLLPSFGIEIGPLVDESVATSSLRMAAFSRMFGIVLACLGTALWVVNTKASSQELGFIAGMVFLASMLSFAQQIAIWGTPAGGLLTMLFAAAGGALAARSISRRREANAVEFGAPAGG